MSQLSFFSAAAREPLLEDVEGLLAGTGQVVRRERTARISVVVEQDRVAALVAELALVGVTADVAPADPGERRADAATVRTPWLAELFGCAQAWTRGAVKQPPAGWTLDGSRLRWWCLADGSASAGSYSLALGPNDEPAWPAVGAALAAAGIPGLLVGPRAAGPAYRIVGARRLARLRELVGEPPATLPTPAWPAADYARGA